MKIFTSNITTLFSKNRIIKILPASIMALFLVIGGIGKVLGQTSFTSTTATGAWNTSRWNNTTDGPTYTAAYVANNAVSFTAGSYSFAGMGATTNVGNVTVASGVNVTFPTPGSTYATGGFVRTIDVGSNGLFDLNSNSVSTAAGTGFIKSGTGVFGTGGGAFTNGFVLNAGTVIARGTTGLGSGGTNFLTLNGGVMASNATRTFDNTRFPGGIVIGGDVQFGEMATVVPLANSTAGLSFANNISSGNSLRTLTLGNGGTMSFSGIISNTGSGGITFTANANGTGRFDVTNTANTFSGPININGDGITGVAEVRFTADGSLGNTGNTININGGRLATLSGATYTLTSGRGIQVGNTPGTSISTPGAGVLTYNGVIADITGATPGSWAKQGGGTLSLGGVSTYTGATTISNGIVQLTTGDDRLPVATALSLGQTASANVGILDLNGRNQTVASLNSISGTNALPASNNIITSVSAATFTVSGAGSYGDGTDANSGIITGAISLVKTGAGTLTLGDANTYTGTTTVNGGTLQLNRTGGTTISATNNITVNGGILKISTNQTLNNLIVISGSVIIDPGVTLTVASITGAGLITGSPTSSLIITGSGSVLNFDQTTSATRSLSNLTLSSGSATLGTALDVYGTVGLTTASLNLNTQNLTLKSTSTATARVSDLTGSTLTGATNVTVERYINSDVVGRKWHLLSGVSTITSQNILQSWQENGVVATGLGTWITSGTTSLPGYDATSAGSSSILTHNYAGPAWVTPVATNTGSISDSAGYMIFVRGDRNATAGNALTAPTVLRTNGTLRQGTLTGVPLLNSSPAYTLVGNPYASPVDFEAIAGTTNLSPFFYIWDASFAGTYGVGGFRLVQRTGANTYTATPTTGSDNTLRYIHSGQALFMKTNGSGDASVVFTEATKASLTSVVNPIVQVAGDQQIYTSLLVVNGGKENLADAVRVRFNNAYKAATTDDAPKMGNFAENIASFRNNQKWIVEQRPMIQQNDTIFLRMSNTGIKNYRLQINSIDFVQSGVNAYLEDAYKGSRTALDLNGAVNNVDFSITADAASANPDRFRIVFKNKVLQPQTAVTVKAVQQNAGIAVTWKAANQYNIKQYEVEKSADGMHYSKVETQTAVGANGSDVTYNWLDVNTVTGKNHYKVSTVSTNGDVTISDVVVVTIDKVNPAITVYPNPVINHTVSLQFTNTEKGIYQLRLYNIMGQVVFAKTVNYAGGNSIQNLVLSNGIAKGNYRLEVIKPDNTKTNQAIFLTK